MVLCITHTNDFFTVDIVKQHLEKRGVPVFRFNSDDFACQYQLKYSLQKNVSKLSFQLGDLEVCVEDIKAVWYRKLWPFKLPEDLDPAYENVYRKEYQTHLQIFLDALSDVPWMNPMQADHDVGSNKLYQLQAAQSVGLKTPDTIFTNVPDTIRAFYKHYNNGVIAKLHGALSKSMEGNTPFFPTTKLNDSDLNELESLAYCPMIFQEFVQKEYELRVVYVDGVCFTGKISNGSDATDWRIMKHPVRWLHYDLPACEQNRIHALMRRLSLTFGAIDMIKNLKGEYIFLEVNPQGEWGMLQKYLDYPIGETIAEKLLNRIRNVYKESFNNNTY